MPISLRELQHIAPAEDAGPEERSRVTASLLEASAQIGWLRKVVRNPNESQRRKRPVFTSLMALRSIGCFSPDILRTEPSSPPLVRPQTAPPGPSPQYLGSWGRATTASRTSRSCLKSPTASSPSPRHAESPSSAAPSPSPSPSPELGEHEDDSSSFVVDGIMSCVEKMPDDQFSKTERMIIECLNLARTDPQKFMERLRAEYRIPYEYVDVRGGLPEQEAKMLATRLQKLAESSAEAVAEMERSHAKEIADVVSAFEAEQNKPIQAKGRKKKHRPSITMDSEEEQRKVAEYKEGLERLAAQHAREREKAQQALDEVQDKLRRCTTGLSIVAEACQYLEQQKPMPPLRYSRGLSLAARDHCVALSTRAEWEKRGSNLTRRCAKYGLLQGKSAETIVMSPSAPLDNSFDLIIDIETQDKTRRKLILDKEFGAVGCGWFRHRVKHAVAVITVASDFQECRHIRMKEHLTLQTVQHQLPFSNVPMTFPITFLGGYGVAARDPTVEHPLACGNVATLCLTVPEGIEVCASLTGTPTPLHRKPRSSVTTLLQYVGNDELRVLARLPSPGRHALNIFAKGHNEVEFKSIGYVLVESTTWRVEERQLTFPLTTKFYSQRRLLLVSPLVSPLKATESVTFAVRVPHINIHARRLSELGQTISEKLEKKRQLEEEERALVNAESEFREGCKRSFAELAMVVSSIKALLEKEKEGQKRKLMQSREISDQQKVLAEAQADAEQNQAKLEEYSASIAVKQRDLQWLQSQITTLQLEKAKLSEEAQSATCKVELTAYNLRRTLVPSDDDPALFHRPNITLPVGRVGLMINGCCVVRWDIED